MGLLSKYVEVKINARNKKHYENLGYEIPKFDKHGTIITVGVNHIPKYSQTKVLCKCDNCNEGCKECSLNEELKRKKTSS